MDRPGRASFCIMMVWRGLLSYIRAIRLVIAAAYDGCSRLGPSLRISHSTVPGHDNAFTCQLPPHLVGAVDLHVDLPDTFNLWHQHRSACGVCAAVPHAFDIPTRRPARPCRVTRSRRHRGTCRVLQDLNRRSSSAWAENALTSFNISLTRRSSLTSRANAFIRRASLIVRPSCTPASTSVRLARSRSRSAAHIQSSVRWNRGPSTATGTLHGTPAPSSPRAYAPWERTCSTCSYQRVEHPHKPGRLTKWSTAFTPLA